MKISYRTLLSPLVVLCLTMGLSACSDGDDDPVSSGNDDTQTETPDTVTPDESETPDVEVDTYYKKVLAFQLTSIGCINCPGMSTALKTAKEDLGDRLSVVAFHTDYGGYSDPMSISLTDTYISKLGAEGLPSCYINLHPEAKVVSDPSAIETAVSAELEAYPAVCGVAIESTYDSSTSKVEVTAKVTASEAVAVRYMILLVEDGIEYFQYGSDEETYVHNNAVRAVLSSNIYGERMNSGNDLEAGVEVTATRTQTLESDWNVANMRVVVAAFVTEDSGKTYFVNNVNECALGGSVDYITID